MLSNIVSTEDSDLQPLHIAAQEGHTAITRFLVEARARVEASDAEEAMAEGPMEQNTLKI